MRKEGTCEGVEGEAVRDNGGRFWFLETIFETHAHSCRGTREKRESELSTVGSWIVLKANENISKPLVALASRKMINDG